MARASLTRRHLFCALTGALGSAAAAGRLAAPGLAQTRPELDEVALAPQFGIAYLPMHVMKRERLVERHLARNGLPNTKVSWAQTGGGAAANDALLSGSVHFVSGGVGPLLTIWDRTRGGAEVKAVGSFDTTALFLNTVNPAVARLRDFTERDRIALPAIKVSIQAVLLQMACEQEFGAGRHEQLDHLTVSMSHPDATAALLSARSEITANFSNPPFQFQQLENPRTRRILSSFDILGGPATVNSMYTTTRVRNDNPRTYKAVFEALIEAHDFIARNRADAARIYLEEEKSRLSADFVNKMLDDPAVKHSITPSRTMTFAAFMHKVGRLRTLPASWKDYFFAEAHGLTGS